MSTLPNTSIKHLRTVEALRAWRRPLRDTQRLVSLVPTMGALHAGHLSLIRAAALRSHHVVVSLFVNPTQFGAGEDLATYPSTWDADVRQLAELDRELADDGVNLGRVSAVFHPSAADMYPSGVPSQAADAEGSFVTVSPVGSVLEGASRPTFFRGVATVCMKLFNAVQPDAAYFGQKDVQQTVVVRRMVSDFLLDTRVVVVPTERDPADGLALSSRNVYLGRRRRAVSTVLYRALGAARAAYAEGGHTSRRELMGRADAVVEAVLQEQWALGPKERTLFEVDYISLADPDTMQEVESVDPEKGAVLSGAIKMLPVEEANEGEDLGHSGGPAVRLIDNIILEPRKDD
ncbi:hypothetical protein N3K66_002977 [Trichothecium roseum]|uniref:Uncharacterized protein n=1 Tax=Trichothecium roseum TaxID=47278 RepID=A0ACC0V5H6_9HYPO|nr:hypothetical protein N3K66_002977 [Trichothecium roseum]